MDGNVWKLAGHGLKHVIFLLLGRACLFNLVKSQINLNLFSIIHPIAKYSYGKYTVASKLIRIAMLVLIIID